MRIRAFGAPAVAVAFAVLRWAAPAGAVEPTLDVTFGVGGFARTNVQSGYTDTPFDLAVQPDGKIVTAGSSDGPGGRFIALTRHLDDGSPDTLFDSDGKVAVHFVLRDQAEATALQDDGKIVVVGQQAVNNFGSSIIPSIYRFNADGSIDSLFGDDGAVVGRWDPISSGWMSGVAVLPDGKILAVGRCSPNANGGNHGLGLRRLLADGSVDPSYGASGNQLHLLNTFQMLYPRPGVGFTSDFGALIANTVFRNGRVEFLVMRVDSDGNTVPFPSGGVLLPEIEVADEPLTLGVRDDGTFLVAGTTPAGGGLTYISAFGFLEDGTIDSTFGTNGRVDFDLSIYPDKGTDMVLAANGKILLAGNIGTDGVLVRLHPDGTPDTSFGTNGAAVIDVGEGINNGYLTALAFDGQQRLLAAGLDFTDVGNLALARFDAEPTGVGERAPAFSVVVHAYPNPTGAGATFAFDLPGESEVALEVFDVAGRRVATLARGERRSAGRHEVHWPGANTPSGIYFARITARDAAGRVIGRASSRVVRLR